MQKFLFSLTGLLLSGCTHLFYYPTDRIYFDPAKFHLSVEDVWLKAGDEKIHAWYFKAETPRPKGSFVFFHGNAENLTSHFIHLGWLPAEGYSYLIFDYPGYGKSTGKPSPEGTVKAGIAAVEWLFSKEEMPVMIYGQSLGGAIAQRAVLEVKDRIPIKAVVLDSTFNSYQKIGRVKLSHSFLTWALQPLTYVLLSDRWAAKDVGKISPIPVLVIYGTNDQIVEPELGEDLFQKLKDPKELWMIEGGYHTDFFFKDRDVHRARFLKWLEGLK